MKSSESDAQYKVVIIGAGLSGLAAAQTLSDQRYRDFIVLEKGTVPGGRVRTIEKDGFLLDLGFQVGLSSYPAFHSILPLRKLQPRFFGSGALVEEQPGRLNCLANPLRHPARIGNGILSSLPIGDRARLVGMAAECLFRADSKLTESLGQSSREWLKKKGFSDLIIDKFFRPFFGGVFLDDKLETDAALLRYYLKKFVTGRAFVPAGGMSQMGEILAASIPEGKIRYQSEVENLISDDDGVIIKLKHEEVIRSEKVILAADPGTIHRLLGWENTPKFRSTKVLYFKSPRPLYEGKWIVLPTTEDRVTQHFVQITNTAPELAPDGQNLLSATVLDDQKLDDASLALKVKDEISSLYPGADKLLELVEIVSVPSALPVQNPGARKFGKEEIPKQIYPAGDLINNASLQNALETGREAALKVLNRR